jgi:hypothetical protein
VVHALRGLKELDSDELKKIYGEPPTFNHLCWPETTQKLETEKDAHWIFIEKDQAYMVAVISWIEHLICRKEVKNKTHL